MTDGDPWSVKQHHWKSEAKEDHQLSPGKHVLRCQPRPQFLEWYINGNKSAWSSQKLRVGQVSSNIAIFRPYQSMLNIEEQLCKPLRTGVKRMQRPGTVAIRTQIQPTKPKQEITKITNSENTKRAYGQPCEQLFPKR